MKLEIPRLGKGRAASVLGGGHGGDNGIRCGWYLLDGKDFWWGQRQH